jgi:hypothetical protein
MEPTKDERLWRIAQKRAGFRKALYSYLVICAFFWAIWWFTSGRHTGVRGYPWPVWVMLGWGVGLGFQYFNAYNGDREDMTRQEYEKMKKDQNR